MKLNPPPRAFGLTFLGGALGTGVRLVVSIFLSSTAAVLAVNLIGTFFLGWVNGSSQRTANPRFASAESKWFWGAGFAGGFTTMSGLAMGFVLITGNFGAIAALTYIGLQFAASLFAYALGFRLAKGAWPSV